MMNMKWWERAIIVIGLAAILFIAFMIAGEWPTSHVAHP